MRITCLSHARGLLRLATRMRLQAADQPAGFSLRRRLLPEIESAGTGLGARSPDRGAHRHEHLPPLVHVVGNRSRAGQIRLARLRPHDGSRRAERHQSRDRGIHHRRAGVDVSQISARALSSRATAAVVNSSIGGSSATGGFPGLCLDNPEVRAAAEKFLVALVEHYRNHPALLGYDLWNENTYGGGNPAQDVLLLRRHQAQAARVAAQAHIGTVEEAAQAWNRYSYCVLGRCRAAIRFRRLSGEPRLAAVPHRRRLRSAALAHRAVSASSIPNT